MPLPDPEPVLRFVIQMHQARTLHFDFRLEKDGVFKSWVVPKGISEEIGVRRLALETEDHTIGFGDFEGEIPEGEYGAGAIEIWDSGTYSCQQWNEDSIRIRLVGERVSGEYSLVRFDAAGPRAWLIFRRSGC